MENKKQSVALSSVFASAGLTLIKLTVGIITQSIGIISEAAHSALDLLAALLTYFAVRVGDKPADEEHPYGHGKVENVSALIETALLFLTSAWIIYESIERLFFKNIEVDVKWYSFAVMIVSIIVDISRSRALSKVAKETSSQALEADALHFSSDVWSSLVVLLGLIFVSFGINKADAIAAIVVAIFVIYVGYKLGKRTIDVLIDTAPEGLTQNVNDAIKIVDGVLGVERLRVRPVGISVFVDVIVTVNRKLSLEKTQSICHNIENGIRELIPNADITVNTKPLPLDNETIVERVQIAATNNNHLIHNVVIHTNNNKKYLNFDLEVDANLGIKHAHQIASNFENILRNEIGQDIDINIHIEPLESEIITGENVTAAEEKRIKKIVSDVIKNFKLVKDVHNINITRIKNEFFMSLHCSFDDDASLVEVHNIASRIEFLVKEKLTDTKRVIVHAEPSSSEEEI